MKEFLIKETGYVIRYHDLPGKERPIIFIHGLGCASSFDFPEVAAQDSLRNHRRILVDLLGAGYSEKPEQFTYTVEDHAAYLLEFIRFLDLGSFILFGHSLGGAVALVLADQCRDNLHHVILSEPNLDRSSEDSASKYIADFELQEFINQGFHKLVKDSDSSGNGMWAASLSVWLPKAAYLISKAAAAGGKPAWRDLLYSLNCFRTVIFGEKSLPDPDMQILMEQGVRTEVVKDAGHSMAWENPKGLAAAISMAIQSGE